MRAFLILAMLVASPVSAQVMNPDTNAAAAAAEAAAAKARADAAAATAAQAKTAADTAAANIATAQTQANAAKAAADAAALAAAAACKPMATVPPVEVVGGTTGSGTDCRLVNSANNRITRTGQFSVGANGMVTCMGSTTCAWADPLPAGYASYPMFFTGIGTAGALAIRCMAITSANTGFSAQCRQEVAAISILGAAVSILAPSGTQVFAIALPATQPNR